MTKGDEVLTHKKPIPHDLNSLKDVLVASLLDNDYLGYDSATGKWKNKANVLLLDGSRAMTGNLKIKETGNRILFQVDEINSIIQGISLNDIGFFAAQFLDSNVTFDCMLGLYPNQRESWFGVDTTSAYGGFYDYATDYWIEFTSLLGIILHGPLFLGLGSIAGLPEASSSYRGMMIRVEGGAGVADKLYICMKSAADTYSWVQIASG